MHSDPSKLADAQTTKQPDKSQTSTQKPATKQAAKAEIGGRSGLDPTRYGDWEKDGRCIGF